MKILVTGGAGFIGSHLCERLREQHEVTSLDNYFTGSTDNHVDGVKYIEGSTWDIEDHIKFKPDIIFHLGEYSRVEQSISEPRKVHEFNTQGTFEVLEFARECGSKLIYSGSSTKFSSSDDYTPSPYVVSKRQNTELVKMYHEWYGLNYAITYFYNVYGPREIATGPYSTLIAKFAELKRQGKPLTIYGDGEQKRNFTHVKDIVEGLYLVGFSQNGFGDEFGIGSDQSYSVQEVSKLFGGAVQYLPASPYSRPHGELKTDRTKALGWKTHYDLETYIGDLEL